MTKLYVMWCDESRLYKVGYSDDPAKRARYLETSSPVPVTIRLVVWMWAFYPLELSAHKYLAELRERGEWFRGGPKLDALVDAMRGDVLLRRHMNDHADIFEIAESRPLARYELGDALIAKPRKSLAELMTDLPRLASAA